MRRLISMSALGSTRRERGMKRILFDQFVAVRDAVVGRAKLLLSRAFAAKTARRASAVSSAERSLALPEAAHPGLSVSEPELTRLRMRSASSCRPAVTRILARLICHLRFLGSCATAFSMVAIAAS